MGLISVLFGFILGMVIIGLAIVMRGDPTYFIELPAILVTLGGTLCACIFAFPLTAILSSVKNAFKIYFSKNPSPDVSFRTLVEVAHQARRDGFISLTVKGEGGHLNFLKLGVNLLADGIDADKIHSIMRVRSELLSRTYQNGEKVFHQLSTLAPMFGLMGTLIGLVFMLRLVDDPEKIPFAMSLALLTTFYGILLSALVFTPIAARFRTRNEHESKIREMIIRGILSIQAGDSSRIVKEKLQAYHQTFEERSS
jgi:chemotaxis protein MotA